MDKNNERNYTQELTDAEDNITAKLAVVKDFVDNVLREGEDYGIITGFTKPSLYKSGAEKLSALFGLGSRCEIVSHHIDMNRSVKGTKWNSETRQREEIDVFGFFTYDVRCDLVDGNGLVVGSGLGSANTFEKKFMNPDGGYQSVNTVVKMAKKRAFVDAILTYTVVSGMFYQDVEDLDEEEKNEVVQKTESKTSNKVDVVPTFGTFKGKSLNDPSIPLTSLEWYKTAYTTNAEKNPQYATVSLANAKKIEEIIKLRK